jgi:hypothetical protein
MLMLLTLIIHLFSDDKFTSFCQVELYLFLIRIQRFSLTLRGVQNYQRQIC